MSRPRWAPAGAWALAILAGTSIPGRDLPPLFPYADKLVHLTLYAVLGVLVARALRPAPAARPAPGALALALAGIALFAAADEWHQQFIPGRSMDPADWLADTVGAAAGLSLIAYTLRSEQRT